MKSQHNNEKNIFTLKPENTPTHIYTRIHTHIPQTIALTDVYDQNQSTQTNPLPNETGQPRGDD